MICTDDGRFRWNVSAAGKFQDLSGPTRPYSFFNENFVGDTLPKTYTTIAKVEQKRAVTLTIFMRERSASRDTPNLRKDYICRISLSSTSIMPSIRPRGLGMKRSRYDGTRRWKNLATTPHSLRHRRQFGLSRCRLARCQSQGSYYLSGERLYSATQKLMAVSPPSKM